MFQNKKLNLKWGKKKPSSSSAQVSRRSHTACDERAEMRPISGKHCIIDLGGRLARGQF